MAFGNNVRKAGDGISAFLYIGFIGLIFLVIYGNLSGNLGFATGTQGANDTTAVINNLTTGVLTFFGFSNTIFTILAVSLLIVILLGLLKLVQSVQNRRGGGGFAS